jgi:predicted DNA-binding helix-hairpin-helix protein
MVTQFVVGAVGESDLELLSTTASLHKQLRLARAYFSAFRPVSDTPLEDHPPTPPLRQQRLYQASFLLRDYGFDLEELPFEGPGNLPASTDPKTAWAKANISETPIELNWADRRQLLRIPGIGPKGANAILNARRRGSLKRVEDLRKIGINPQRSLPFILLNGKRPIYQQAFW